MKRGRVLLLLCLATGCDRAEPEPAPEPSGVIRIELDRGRVAMPVPPGFVKMQDSIREKVEDDLASRGAEVQVLGYEYPDGGWTGSIYVAVVRYVSTRETIGHSVRTFTDTHVRAKVESLGERYGRTFRFEQSVRSDHIRATATAPEKDGRKAMLVVRVDAPNPQEIVERYCFCEGSGCTTRLPTCEFKKLSEFELQPVDAQTAMNGVARIPDTPFARPVTALVPRFFQPRHELEADPPPAPIDVIVRPRRSFASYDPDAPDRFVRLATVPLCSVDPLPGTQWKPPRLPDCSAKQQAELITDRVKKVWPDAKVDVTPARDGDTELEITYSGGWERHVFFEYPDTSVSQSACSCGGQACLVAKDSCTFDRNKSRARTPAAEWVVD